MIMIRYVLKTVLEAPIDQYWQWKERIDQSILTVERKDRSIGTDSGKKGSIHQYWQWKERIDHFITSDN